MLIDNVKERYQALEMKKEQDIDNAKRVNSRLVKYFYDQYSDKIKDILETVKYCRDNNIDPGFVSLMTNDFALKSTMSPFNFREYPVTLGFSHENYHAFRFNGIKGIDLKFSISPKFQDDAYVNELSKTETYYEIEDIAVYHEDKEVLEKAIKIFPNYYKIFEKAVMDKLQEMEEKAGIKSSQQLLDSMGNEIKKDQIESDSSQQNKLKDTPVKIVVRDYKGEISTINFDTVQELIDCFENLRNKEYKLLEHSLNSDSYCATTLKDFVEELKERIEDQEIEEEFEYE